MLPPKYPTCLASSCLEGKSISKHEYHSDKTSHVKKTQHSQRWPGGLPTKELLMLYPSNAESNSIRKQSSLQATSKNNTQSLARIKVLCSCAMLPFVAVLVNKNDNSTRFLQIPGTMFVDARSYPHVSCEVQYHGVRILISCSPWL